MASETPGVDINHYLQGVRAIMLYLLSKWWRFVLVGLICAALGITYAWMQKPVYTAELTFAADNDNSSALGGYANLAAQFGYDIGAGGGGVFEGDNLMLLLKSRLLIEKTLLSPVQIDNQSILLINYLIDVQKIRKNWADDDRLNKLVFTADYNPGNRVADSVMKVMYKNIVEGALTIDKVDKKMNLIAVRLKNTDEVFAMLFVEQLVKNAIQFYTDYKVKKTKQNVQILQRQTDSVRAMLTGGISSVAQTNDLNINPLRQVARVGVQKKQIDVQVNSQLYEELLKQLEFSKITLRKETPFIQIIDSPRLPLDKKKLGRLFAGVVFGIAGCFFYLIILLFKVWSRGGFYGKLN